MGLFKPHNIVFLLLWICISQEQIKANPNSFQLDPSCSFIKFKIESRLAKVEGKFRDFRIEPAHFSKSESKLKVIVKTASLSTENSLRDAHLKSEDFFDVQNYPEALFQLSSGHPIDLDSRKQRIAGDLTIKDETKRVDFLLSKKGDKHIYEGEFRIQRSDYGIDYQSNINPIDKEVRIAFQICLR